MTTVANFGTKLDRHILYSCTLVLTMLDCTKGGTFGLLANLGLDSMVQCVYLRNQQMKTQNLKNKRELRFLPGADAPGAVVQQIHDSRMA